VKLVFLQIKTLRNARVQRRRTHNEIPSQRVVEKLKIKKHSSLRLPMYSLKSSECATGFPELWSPLHDKSEKGLPLFGRPEFKFDIFYLSCSRPSGRAALWRGLSRS
jgi:hypothetical protein